MSDAKHQDASGTNVNDQTADCQNQEQGEPVNPDVDYRKVRDFNRALAVRLNVFGHRALGSRWTLSEGRVIIEIGRARECTATEISAALGMDKGNLSRIVSKLANQGIVERRAEGVSRSSTRNLPRSPSHSSSRNPARSSSRNSSILELTPEGEKAYRELDRLSDAQAQEMLEGLSDEEKKQAVDAMETVRVLLAKASSSPVVVVDGEKHVSEFAELVREYVTVEIGARRGFSVDFQDPEAEIAHLPGKYAHPNGAMFVAMVDNVAAGCVAYRRIDDSTCEMKRLYVRPAFRGRHVASVLMQHLCDAAKKAGYNRAVLDTDASMVEAISMYEHMGFKPCEPYYDNPLPTARYFAMDIKNIHV